MMMRSTSSVFLEHRLLHCQTIEQCLMLNAYVRKGRGKPHAEKKWTGVEKEVPLCGCPLWTTPKEKWVNEGSWFHSTWPMKIKYLGFGYSRSSEVGRQGR